LGYVHTNRFIRHMECWAAVMQLPLGGHTMKRVEPSGTRR
jgi:hypothetical protein